jgi:hypothetical protein
MSAYAIAGVLPRHSVRGVAGQAAGGLLVAAVAAGLTVLVASRATASGVAVVFVLAGSLWFATTRRTPLALALLMLYLGTLDGYLKLSTGSTYVTFVRDVLLYAIVCGLLVRAAVNGRRLAAPPLSGWVICFVVLVLIQLANPQGGSLSHSLAGVRQSLEFVPLFFLAYTFVRTKKALRGFVILLALLAAVNGVADVVQFRESPQQFAAWGPGYSQRIVGTGQFQGSGRAFYDTSGQTHTRPFGLMSDAGSGGLVCAFALGCAVALALTPAGRRSWGLAAITAILAVAGIVTAQGRAVIVCSVVVVLAYALLTVTSRRGLATLVVLGAFGGLAAFFAFTILGGSKSAAIRYQGQLGASTILTTTSHARGGSIALIPHNLSTYPLGAGLGVGGPAAGQSGAPPDASLGRGIDTENEISFATVETGIPGMLDVIGFTVVVFALGLVRCRREPDPEARVLLAAIIAPIGGMLALYSVSALTPTSPGGPYLWAAGGIASYWLITRPAELRRAVDDPGQAAARLPSHPPGVRGSASDDRRVPAVTS